MKQGELKLGVKKARRLKRYTWEFKTHKGETHVKTETSYISTAEKFMEVIFSFACYNKDIDKNTIKFLREENVY